MPRRKNLGFPRRVLGRRRYRKRFVISAEGSKTERQYFNLLNRLLDQIHIQLIPTDSKSAPRYVLKKMKRYIDRYSTEKDDEYWLVVDTDQWSQEHLMELHRWSQSDQKFGLAVSKPAFEYWLLLHFEDATGVYSVADCRRRLKQYVPYYDRAINSNMFSLEYINAAVQRAEDQASHSHVKSPWDSRGTTLYRLVQRMLNC